MTDDPKPHRETHIKSYPLFTKEELLALDYEDGGMIRHTVIRGDGLQESVGLSNLVAIISRFCTDPLGNHFGAYIIVPESFWRACQRQALEQLGRGLKTFPKDKNGGVLGVIANCTIYHGGVDRVLLRSDHNGLCWSFEVGSEYKIKDRNEIRALVGMNKGFDLEFPFFPTLGWAPIALIEEWAAKGLISAQQALKNPELYAYWERKERLAQQKALTNG